MCRRRESSAVESEHGEERAAEGGVEEEAEEDEEGRGEGEGDMRAVRSDDKAPRFRVPLSEETLLELAAAEAERSEGGGGGKGGRRMKIINFSVTREAKQRLGTTSTSVIFRME